MLTADQTEALFRPTAEARGLPAFAYTCEDFAREERTRLFARTWTCAGYAHEAPEPGDVATRTVAGVPLLFARSRTGEVKCFHNVCSHRGALLVSGAARGRRALRCRYHGWTYDLDGALRATPHWGGHNRPDAEGFDKSRLALKPVRMARWRDWLFVNIDGEAEPFEGLRRALPGQGRGIRPGRGHVAPDPVLRDRRQLEAGGGELPRDAAPRLRPHRARRSGALRGARRRRRRRGPGHDHRRRPARFLDGRGPPAALARHRRRQPHGQESGALPQLQVRHRPRPLLLHGRVPDGAGVSHQRWDFYFHGEGASAARYEAARDSIVDFYDKTNIEDFEAVEAVHRGHASPAMAGARFNGIWEGGVHHFQKLVAGYMAA